MAQAIRTFQAEEARILEVYAKRERDIPGDRYSRLHPANLYIMQAIERSLARSLRRFGYAALEQKRILAAGCGSGGWLNSLVLMGARPENLYGIDLLRDKIAEARRTLPEAVTLKVGNAAHLPWADASFDLVTQFTVFSSILEARLRHQVAQEMLRVTKPRGHIVWFDFFVNNPFNKDVRGVRKQEIRKLFPGCRMHFERLTFVAPLARRLPSICPLLGSVKIFATHYLAFIQVP